jgi:hypothetical protein
MATWPGTLPSPIADGYQEIMADNAIRTQMDVGLAKVRKRSTAAPVRFQLAYNMTATQVTTLETFFNTTINDGVDQFTMANPRTTVSENFRITAPPQITISSGTNYRVVITMERLP